ncbi:unnamed protein product, partial [Closterium sp. NIES-53]
AERSRWAELLRSGVAIFDLDYDAILVAMYALSVSAEGDCYLCVPPDPSIEAAALGASESALPGTAQRVSICTCTWTGRHLATFTRRPGSSLYTLATGPPQTLLWHHRLGHPSLPRLRGMNSRLLVSGLPQSLPPLPPSPAPPCLPCVEGRQRAAPHSSSFPLMSAPLQTLNMDVWGSAHVSGQGRERYFLLDLPVLRVHSDRGGEFSSDLLRDFCRGEGILQSFTLPASPQQSGIAERRVGLVMEVAHTSMIHAAAPHFLGLFAVWYAAHQLNLWQHVSLPETSPTLRWTGEVGDASVFQSVPFYRLFPYRSAPPPPPPLFLAPDPLPGTVPVEVAVGSCAAQGAGSGGVEPGEAELGGAEPEGVEPKGAESKGAGSGGAEPQGADPGVAESEGAEFGGAELRGTATSGGPAGSSPRMSPRPESLSPQQLRGWFAQCTRLWNGGAVVGDSASGDTRVGGVRATHLGGAGVTDGAGGTGVVAAAGLRGARTRGTGAAGTGGVQGAGAGRAGAGDPAERGGAGAGGTCPITGAGGAGAGGAGAGDTGSVDPVAGGAGAGGAGSSGTGAGGTVRPRPYFVPLLQQVLGLLVPRPRPPPVPGTHAMALRPNSVPLRVPLPPPPESLFVQSLTLMSCSYCTSFRFHAAGSEGDQDAPDIPNPRSYAEAITGPYSSQWQAAMDAALRHC